MGGEGSKYNNPVDSGDIKVGKMWEQAANPPPIGRYDPDPKPAEPPTPPRAETPPAPPAPVDPLAKKIG